LLAEVNYNIFDKDIIAMVLALWKWRHFLLGAEYKAIVYYEHQNLTYINTAVSINRRQLRWAGEL